MSSEDIDLDFFGMKDEILSHDEQTEKIDIIEELIEDEPVEIPADRVITFVPQEAPNDLRDQHPLHGFNEVIERLERIARIATDERMQDPDPAWLTAEIASLREVRMNYQNVLPHYNEYLTQLGEDNDREKEEHERFTNSWIRKKYGEKILNEFLDAKEKWLKEI